LVVENAKKMSIGWKEAAEIVGISAIVASLIFVGMELRQSQRIAIAGQYQDRAEIYTIMMLERQALRSSSENPANAIRAHYAEVIPQSRFDSMTDEGIAIQSVSANVNLALFDNNFYQYQSGLMAEESWQAQRRRFKSALQRSDFMRAEIAVRGDRYRDSFLALANEIVSEIEQ
jgi:hypothetical protein